MKVIALAPSRISLFGGGTDVYSDASRFGGLCLNMAINLRHRIELSTSGEDDVEPFDNPKFYKRLIGREVHLSHRYDNTIESGLGSSAGFAVALVGAMAKLNGENPTPAEIAEKAWTREVHEIGMFGGRQDQYCIAYGGVNAMEFDSKEVKVTPLAKGYIAPLLPSLVLFNTGVTRKNTKIQEGLKELTDEQIKQLNIIKSIALDAIDPIAKGDYETVAGLMQEAWKAKKASNRGVSNEEIDKIYQMGITAGAMAGKLLGSGGGGHILFVIEPATREKFIKEMEKKGLKWVDFSVDWNGVETRTI